RTRCSATAWCTRFWLHTSPTMSKRDFCKRTAVICAPGNRRADAARVLLEVLPPSTPRNFSSDLRKASRRPRRSPFPRRCGRLGCRRVEDWPDEHYWTGFDWTGYDRTGYKRLSCEGKGIITRNVSLFFASCQRRETIEQREEGR